MKVSLKEIREAAERLAGVVKHTNLEKSFSASKLLGTEIFFKYENAQLTGSFKIRGAYNKIASLTEKEKKQGVIASSAGNHAQGVAYSAGEAKVKSTIVMPETAPLIKVNATREYGANVVLHGQVYDDAYQKARELAEKEGYQFVHPYEDEKIIAGQGTIGLEIFEQLPTATSVVIPIGGGGLISGVATALKALNPKIKIIGVQSNLAPGMHGFFHKSECKSGVKPQATIADGIAIKHPSRVMYESFISKLVDDVVTVSDDEIAEAIFFLIERAKSVSEGSGAAALAAAMYRKIDLGSKPVILISGGNIDLNLVAKVIDQGLIKKGRLVEISVVAGDIPGVLNRITEILAKERANVLQVHHDRADHSLHLREARIDFLVETMSLDHATRIREALAKIGGLRIIK